MFDEESENLGFETKLLQSNTTLMHPVIVSEITDAKVSKAEVQTLAHMPSDGSYQRVRISVAHMSSADSKCVKVRDAKSGEIVSKSSVTNLKKG